MKPLILLFLLLTACTKQDDIVPITQSYAGNYEITCPELGVTFAGQNTVCIQPLHGKELLIRSMGTLTTAIQASDTSFDYCKFTVSYNYCHTTVNVILSGHSVIRGDSLIEGDTCIVFRNGRCSYGSWWNKGKRISG